MRAVVLASVLGVLATPAASAGPEVPYAERMALLGSDRKCGLFEPDLHNALAAAAAQARGALLRSGWTETRTDDLGRRALSEGASHSCTDPRVATAAATARSSFTVWARLPSMRFPGGERAWLARRTPDPEGMLLRQDMSAPAPAMFGVRQHETRFDLVFAAPLAEGAAAPSGARIYLRDRTRAPRSAADLPGRTTKGLAALAASPASSTVVWASSRRVETRAKQRYIVLYFPRDAIAAIAALDPREAIVIEIDAPRGPQRYLVEVGDFAAARAFIAA